MADVFISHARADKARVAPLVKAIEHVGRNPNGNRRVPVLAINLLPFGFRHLRFHPYGGNRAAGFLRLRVPCGAGSALRGWQAMASKTEARLAAGAKSDVAGAAAAKPEH